MEPHSSTDGAPAAPALDLGALPVRAVVLAAAWLVISGGGAAYWAVGVPAIVLAALVTAPRSDERLRLWRLDRVARFAVFYVVHAIAGGVDVSIRALDPRRSLDPGFERYPLRLPPGPSRSLLAVTISMLPGTVAAEVVDGDLVVQRIHSGVDVAGGCRRAEERIAPLFGHSLEGGRRADA